MTAAERERERDRLLTRTTVVLDSLETTVGELRSDVRDVRDRLEVVATLNQQVQALNQGLDEAERQRTKIAENGHKERGLIDARVTRLEQSKWWLVGLGAGVGGAIAVIYNLSKTAAAVWLK